jgi:hypothetical protein
MANIRTPRLQTNVENTVRGAYNDPIVIGSLVGALAVISYNDLRNGNAPAPKKIFALLLVYGLLGVVTVSDNRLGRSFAVLILVGLVIKEWPSLSGKATKSTGTKPVPISNPGQTGMFDFPLPNPVAKSPHTPIIPKKKSGKGTHNQ